MEQTGDVNAKILKWQKPYSIKDKALFFSVGIKQTGSCFF